jgi:hypothetical protein
LRLKRRTLALLFAVDQYRPIYRSSEDFIPGNFAEEAVVARGPARSRSNDGINENKKAGGAVGCARLGPAQRQERDFRGYTEPHWRTDGAEPAIHINRSQR